MGKHISNINRDASNGQTLVFTDNSACEFIGHSIRLIDDINNK